MQDNSVNKGTFHFLGATIWASMSGYQYENPSGYIFDDYLPLFNNPPCFIDFICISPYSHLGKVLSSFKAAATCMRYFARSKFFRSLVHKKNFGLIWQVAFKLGCLFCQVRKGTFFEFE